MLTASGSDLLTLVWPVLIPLTLAAVTACFWAYPKLQRAISLAGLGVLALSAVLLVRAVLAHDVLAVEFGSWAVPFGISFVADRLAAALVTITVVLALCVGVFGLADLRKRHERAGFYPLFFGGICHNKIQYVGNFVIDKIVDIVLSHDNLRQEFCVVNHAI